MNVIKNSQLLINLRNPMGVSKMFRLTLYSVTLLLYYRSVEKSPLRGLAVLLQK